jgi:hypothetical protein
MMTIGGVNSTTPSGAVRWKRSVDAPERYVTASIGVKKLVAVSASKKARPALVGGVRGGNALR